MVSFVLSRGREVLRPSTPNSTSPSLSIPTVRRVRRDLNISFLKRRVWFSDQIRFSRALGRDRPTTLTEKTKEFQNQGKSGCLSQPLCQNLRVREMQVVYPIPTSESERIKISGSES